MTNPAQTIISFVALLAIGGACAFLLSAVNEHTAPHIEANRTAQRLSVINDILPAEVALPTSLSFPFGNCEHGLIMQIVEPGYAGNIEFLAVFQTEGMSLRVVRHQETPGIGDFIGGSWLHQRDG